MKHLYTDVTGQEFKLDLWCNHFLKECDNVSDDEKEKCHGICTACSECEPI